VAVFKLTFVERISELADAQIKVPKLRAMKEYRGVEVSPHAVYIASVDGGE
jgi:hypothetical protein